MNGNLLEFLFISFGPGPKEKVHQNGIHSQIGSSILSQNLLGLVPDQFARVNAASSDLHFPPIATFQQNSFFQSLRERGRVGDGAGESQSLRDAIVGEHGHSRQIHEYSETSAAQATPNVRHQYLSAFIKANADVVKHGFVSERREVFDNEPDQLGSGPFARLDEMMERPLEFLEEASTGLMENLESFVEKRDFLLRLRPEDASKIGGGNCGENARIRHSEAGIQSAIDLGKSGNGRVNKLLGSKQHRSE